MHADGVATLSLQLEYPTIQHFHYPQEHQKNQEKQRIADVAMLHVHKHSLLELPHSRSPTTTPDFRILQGVPVLCRLQIVHSNWHSQSHSLCACQQVSSCQFRIIKVHWHIHPLLNGRWYNRRLCMHELVGPQLGALMDTAIVCKCYER